MYSSRLSFEYDVHCGFVSRDPLLLVFLARFTTGYVRLVGQELAPSKSVLLSTSRKLGRI